MWGGEGTEKVEARRLEKGERRTRGKRRENREGEGRKK
jgi:hypothetical protein